MATWVNEQEIGNIRAEYFKVEGLPEAERGFDSRGLAEDEEVKPFKEALEESHRERQEAQANEQAANEQIKQVFSRRGAGCERQEPEAKRLR